MLNKQLAEENEVNALRYPQFLLQLRRLFCQLLQPQFEWIGATMKLILQLRVPPFQLRNPHFHHVSLSDQCSSRGIIFGRTLEMNKKT